MSAGRVALLQLCDSLFPVGSFAHSDGLEAAVTDGHVADGAGLQRWLEAQLHGPLVQLDAPGVRDARAAMLSGDLESLASLDDELYALRTAASSRDATRMQGGRLLKTWQHIRPSAALERAIAVRPSPTLPVAFGIVCGSLKLDAAEALEAFFYTRLSASVSAAMRLMAIGQGEAQFILADLLGEVPACAARAAAASDPPCCFSPRMDIASMRQQYVHSRLFRS